MTQPEEILQLIDQYAITPHDKVTLLNIQCGSGKSQAVSLKMKEVIESEGTDGLLVVTDSVDRMWKYVDPFDPECNAFLQVHSDQITVMSHSNIIEASCIQHNRPILVLTTQRFFSLSRTEIEGYLRWRDGVRPLILFDEKPILNVLMTITRKDVSHITDRLHAIRSSTERNRWIEEWEILRRHCDSMFARAEETDADNKGLYCIYDGHFEGLVTEDINFWKFVDKNKKMICRNDGTLEAKSTYLRLQGLAQLIREGGVQSHRINEDGENENCFYVKLDNRDKVCNLSAKVIILDGTADLSPDYLADYIDRIDCQQFIRDMENLTIQFVDVKTTKSSMNNQGNCKRLCDEIINYLNQQVPDGNKPVVFTYMGYAESLFAVEYNEKGDGGPETDIKRVDHFGNLKGHNDYCEYKYLAHVGLNHFNDINYFLYEVALHPELWDELKEAPDRSAENEIILHHIFDRDYTDITRTPSIRINTIFADLEQNVMRCAIRNQRNTAPVTVFLFFDVSMDHGKMVDAIKQRYPHVQFPEVAYLPAILAFELASQPDADGHRTIVQQIAWRYTVFHKNDVFTAKDIEDDIGITHDQFNKAREHNKKLNILFKMSRIAGTQKYCKLF